MDPVTLADAFASIDEHWSPRVVAECNGQAVKLAVVEGAFVWHHHADTDEQFFVHRGDLTIEFRDRADVELAAGDLFVVPAGVEHRPVAAEECELLLFEAAGTRNTGNVQGERTVGDRPLDHPPLDDRSPDDRSPDE